MDPYLITTVEGSLAPPQQPHSIAVTREVPQDPEDLAQHRTSPTQQAGEDLEDLEVLTVADDQESCEALGLGHH